ncbi:histidine kinase [Christensenellaceae bacterium OttesenSCG-928-L17]|nr:histidine kinase [Christensenellaceae bacterium OttesenSCG-928-L17]
MKKSAEKKLNSLRGTLLFIFLISVLICFGVGMYNFLSTRLLLDDMASFVESSQQLSEVQANLNAVQDEVGDYLFSRSSQSLQNYYDYNNLLFGNADELAQQATYTNSGIRLKNLSGLIEHYLLTAEETVSAKRIESTARYLSLYEELTAEGRALNDYIQNIMAADLQEGALQYDDMKALIQRRTMLSYTLFGVALALVVFMVVTLSTQVTRPIKKLAEYAQSVAGGTYDIDIGEDESSREVSHLYEAFDIMLRNTRQYLVGIAENQALENELYHQQIKGLEMDNALQQAQLQALHAQINPHFIFNTINIGAKMAMMQGDDPVSEYLENVAEVFRYNLEGLNEATLFEELGNVATYMQLLSVRFGAKLDFTLTVQEGMDTDSYLLPRMTLQPLVENAFVHGVQPCEDGGKIAVDAKEQNGRAVITITNTGMQFPEEKIRAIYSGTGMASPPGHISGIGLQNVIKRLQLQFQMERPLEIFSANGETIVQLSLQRQSEEAVAEQGGAPCA